MALFVLDATYLKVREGGRIVSVAAIIAVAVTTEGKREIVGLHIGPCQAEPFWTTFLRDLAKAEAKGREAGHLGRARGLKAAITRVIGATWQRCRVHFMRNALAHVSKGQHTMVAAAIRQAFLQPDHAQATATWRHVADQLRSRWPKLGACMDDAEADVLAYVAFPQQRRVKLHGTNPLERLPRGQATRGRGGHLPNEDSITRLVGAVLLENQRRVAAPAPLHAGGRHGRTHAHPHRGDRHTPHPTPRRLTDGSPEPHSKLHHIDGGYRPEYPKA